MNRIPPSERIQTQIDALLEGEGVNGDELVTKLILLGAQHLGQEMLEQEVTDYLGWGHYERREESNENSGYRPARIDPAEGRVQLQVPQVRESAEPYRSRLVDFLPEGHRDFVRDNSDVLERLAVEMYTRGLSPRDIEDAFREVTGDLLLSRTAVSAITDQLWADYQAFSERDLFEYRFLDGVYEALRRLAGLKEGVLVALRLRSGQCLGDLPGRSEGAFAHGFGQ